MYVFEMGDFNADTGSPKSLTKNIISVRICVCVVRIRAVYVFVYVYVCVCLYIRPCSCWCVCVCGGKGGRWRSCLIGPGPQSPTQCFQTAPPGPGPSGKVKGNDQPIMDPTRTRCFRNSASRTCMSHPWPRGTGIPLPRAGP